MVFVVGALFGLLLTVPAAMRRRREEMCIRDSPIAGAERTGPEAAEAGLYQGRCVILTPLAENSAAAIAVVRDAWRACGAQVIDMDAGAHDRVLASVSHLPHLLSSVYMEQVATADDAATRLALAGSGFRDFTRIAAGSPEMWRDIFLSNRDAMLALSLIHIWP